LSDFFCDFKMENLTWFQNFKISKFQIFFFFFALHSLQTRFPCPIRESSSLTAYLSSQSITYRQHCLHITHLGLNFLFLFFNSFSNRYVVPFRSPNHSKSPPYMAPNLIMIPVISNFMNILHQDEVTRYDSSRNYLNYPIFSHFFAIFLSFFCPHSCPNLILCIELVFTLHKFWSRM